MSVALAGESQKGACFFRLYGWYGIGAVAPGWTTRVYLGLVHFRCIWAVAPGWTTRVYLGLVHFRCVHVSKLTVLLRWSKSQGSVIDLRVCFVSSFAACPCAMANSDWKNELESAQLPKEVVSAILDQGYVTKVAFTMAFKDDDSFETFIERLLTKKKILSDLDDDWACHPVAGMLRGLWHEPAVAVATPNTGSAVGLPDVTSLPALLGITGTKLEVATIQELWKRFSHRNLWMSIAGLAGS